MCKRNWSKKDNRLELPDTKYKCGQKVIDLNIKGHRADWYTKKPYLNRFYNLLEIYWFSWEQVFQFSAQGLEYMPDF